MAEMFAKTAAGFLEPGEDVYFADRDDLLAKLDRLKLDAPGRTEGRRRGHREHFAMLGYLRFLAGEGLLAVPMRLMKPERHPPDFVLEWPADRRETFEVTEGTTKEYQRRQTVAAPKGEPGLILPLEIDTPAKVAGELWAKIQFASFLQKAEALVRGRFSIDHLLIYDNTGLGLFSPLGMGGPLLRDSIEGWLREARPAHRFARISILRGCDLLFDVTGESRLLSAESPYFRLSEIRAEGEDDLRRRLRAIDHYCREHSIRHLKLFGSVLEDVGEDEWEVEDAKHGFGAQSDLDLLVEFEPGTPVTLLDIARMERELGELIGMSVDLRTAADLSRYFRPKVLSEAVELDA